MSQGSRWAGQKRLQAVATLIPRGSRVAEIGTDHGLLARRLLASGAASFCIATDLHRRLLVGLRRTMEGHPRRDLLELRAGDGLDVLGPADRLDVVVLAGIGASSICRILDTPRRADLGLRRLVLQPQSEPARVRRWLVEHGHGIVDERMVHERGRFYVAIAGEPAAGGIALHPGLDREDLLEAGPCLVRSSDPVVRRFWLERLELYERALGGAREAGSRERARRGRDTARRILAALPAAGSDI